MAAAVRLAPEGAAVAAVEARVAVVAAVRVRHLPVEAHPPRTARLVAVAVRAAAELVLPAVAAAGTLIEFVKCGCP
jgi:hypothetical protein